MAGTYFSVPFHVLTAYSPASPPSYNLFYLAKVAVGLPQQVFELLLDTGSNVPWIYSSNCLTAQVCSVPDRYNHALSSTYVPVGNSFSASYYAGSISGVTSGDLWNLTVVNSPYSWVYFDKYAFGEITRSNWYPTSIANANIDGFVGLTIPASSSSGAVVPFFQMLVQRGYLASNLFAIDAANARISFGNFNPSSSITWLPVLPYGAPGYYWWLVQLQDLLVNGVSTGACNQGQCLLMLDSGAGPLSLSNTLGNVAIPNSYPCSQAASLPQISFVVAGGRIFSFAGSDYSISAGGTCWSQVNQDPISNVVRTQRLGNATQAQTLLHLGAPWFQKVYTIHDAQNLRVGLNGY